MLNRFEWLRKSQVFNWFSGQILFIFLQNSPAKLDGNNFDRDKKWVFFPNIFFVTKWNTNLFDYFFWWQYILSKTTKRFCWIHWTNFSFVFGFMQNSLRCIYFWRVQDIFSYCWHSKVKHMNNLSAFIQFHCSFYVSNNKTNSLCNYVVQPFPTRRRRKKTHSKPTQESVQIKIDVIVVLNHF